MSGNSDKKNNYYFWAISKGRDQNNQGRRSHNKEQSQENQIPDSKTHWQNATF